MDLRRFIRDVPDFPKPGIVFKDITPLLGDGGAFTAAIDALCERAKAAMVDAIVGIESRGFIFGAPIATRLGVGFVPVRKPKKLPWKTTSVEYDLEYGKDVLEIHVDGVRPGQRVAIVDDLLATGGTLAAACRLVEGCGGEVATCLVVVELGFLGGRSKLGSRRCERLIHYP